jgi:outer membrane protein assembly factor BamB/tetratricopeptide (TPR) repeat protein
MGLKGDLTTLSLGEVFQTIAMSQKEGTLAVSDGESKKLIYFSKDGVRLISSGTRKSAKLGEILLRQRKVTPEQLEALQNQVKATGTKFGELVVHAGIATEDEVRGAIRAQIEEEIYDLFVWRNAAFEFIEGPPSQETKLFTRDESVTHLVFDVNSVLLEALRRVDEWGRINKVLPPGSAIIAMTELGKSLMNQPNAQAVAKDILGVIDGVRPLSKIIDNSGHPKFETCSALRDMFEGGHLRERGAEDLMRLAEGLCTEKRLDDTVTVCERMIELEPRDGRARKMLAETLKALNRPTDAAAAFMELAKLHASAERTSDAMSAYLKAMECAPKELGLAREYFKVVLKTGDKEKIGEEAIRVSKLHLAAHEAKGAKEVMDQAVAMMPNDFELRVEMANVCSKMGNSTASLEHLKHALNVMPSSAVRDITAIAQRILQIDPTMTDVRIKLEAIASEERHRRIRRLMVTTAIAIGILILAVAALAVVRETGARSRFEQVTKEAEELEKAGKPEEAMAKYDEFIRGASMTLILSKAKAASAAVQSRIAARDAADFASAQAERKVIQESFAKADQADSAGNAPEAIRLYKEFLKFISGKKADDLREKATAALTRLDKSTAEIAELMARIKELRGQSKIVEARKIIAELCLKHPKSEEARAQRLPVRVVSRPEGATVFVDDRETGKTPVVIDLAPGSIVRLRITAAGFEPLKDKLVSADTDTEISVVLDKAVKWRANTGGEIEYAAVAADGLAIIGSTDGHVYAFDINSGALQWKSTCNMSRVTTPLWLTSGAVFAGGGDYGVYSVGIRDGKEIWSQKTGSTVNGVCTMPRREDLLFAASSDKFIYCLSTADGKIVRKAEMPDKVMSICATDTAILATTNDGALVSLAPATLEIQWTLPAGSVTRSAPVLTETRLFAVSPDGALHAFKPDGTKLWRFKLPDVSAGAPCPAERFVVAGCANGSVVAVDTGGSKKMWEYRASGAVSSSVVAADGRFYFGSADRNVYCIDSAGNICWSYRTGDKVSASAIVAEKTVLIGSSDKYLYAFDK